MKKQKLNRPIQMKFRVNSQEKERIELRFKQSRWDSFSVFARNMLMLDKIEMVDMKEIAQLKYEVNKIGVNINQVVKLANESGNISKQDIHQLEIHFEELQNKISEIIATTIKENL